MKSSLSQSVRWPRVDPYWRQARLAARLLLKKEAGQTWSPRDRRLATRLVEAPGVTNRLVDQAVHSISARRRNGYSLLNLID